LQLILLTLKPHQQSEELPSWPKVQADKDQLNQFELLLARPFKFNMEAVNGLKERRKTIDIKRSNQMGLCT
jgi:hypothetical protein